MTSSPWAFVLGCALFAYAIVACSITSVWGVLLLVPLMLAAFFSFAFLYNPTKWPGRVNGQGRTDG